MSLKQWTCCSHPTFLKTVFLSKILETQKLGKKSNHYSRKLVSPTKLESSMPCIIEPKKLPKALMIE